MDTVSLWQAISRPQKSETYPELSEDIEVDVAIIGGGITGLTAAMHLLEAGKSVAILEAYQIGDGTTGNSTGNLYVETQPYYQNIAEKFDLEVARTVAQSRKQAIDEIEQTVWNRKIDCNFSRRPWYIFTEQESEFSKLEKEVETLKKMKFAVDYTKDLPLPFEFRKAATMANQARFNPLRYVKGLAQDLHKKNCAIFENSPVREINEEDGRGVILATEKSKVKAKKIILATHTPKGINHTQMLMGPYRSYVIAVRLRDYKCPEGHFWGMGENQNISSTHAVNSSHPELLLVAGRHHKTGQDKDSLIHFKELEKYVAKQFKSFDIEHRWSAQHYQAADDIPYIGFANKSSKNIFIATGYFADGLVYGTIAGKVLSDLIVKHDGKLANIYNSNRKDFAASAGSFLKENFNIFMQYLKDLPWVSGKNYRDLKAGEGKVLEINSEKCAVCRDENNKLHIVSAVCPHMKCIVNWNNAERTWDCPCHGSRFTYEGKVIEGPAMTDLEKKNIE